MSEFRIPSSNQSVPPSPLPPLSTVSEEQNTTQTCLKDSPSIEEKDSSSISEANSILPSNSPVDYSGDDLEKVGVQIKQSLASIFLNLFTSSSEDKEDPLVERLAARITQQLPNNPTLLESESIGLYKCMLREALKHFPPRNPEASEDEILMDMFNCFAKRGWRVMADNFQKCSPEGSQIAQLANIVSKIDPHVTEHLENHGLEGLFTSGVPIDFSEDVLPFQEEHLKELNSKHGTEFKDVFEAYHFINKKELRASIEERLKSKAEENFIRLTFEAMARASKLKIFAECVCDDIQENLTPETSSVLKLLDLFIIDFIQKYHESIWFNNGKSNFGYHRSESDWEALLVSDAESLSELKSSALLNRVVSVYLDNFEELLDQFHEQAPLFKEHLNQFVKNLDWILTIPLDSCKQLTKEICQKRMSEEEASFSFFLRIFQRAFLTWAIEDVAFEDPELIPEWFTKEIKLRLMIASHLMKLSEDRRVEFISRFQCDEERVVLVEKVQQLMTSGIKAASFACANLVESRKPNHQKTDLTFGFGFKGWLFSSATGIRSSEQEIYLNLSESGRTLPNANCKDQPRSSNSQEQKHFKTKDLIPTKILTRPTEKDKKIHLYLFQRILYHYFVNDRIEVYHKFYSAIKDELMRCIEAKKTVQVNELKKKLKKFKVFVLIFLKKLE